MKILHIVPEAPGTKSGGTLCVRQTLLSLVHNQHKVDYMGPEIEDVTLKKLYNRTYILEPGHNLFLRIYDSLFMNTNQRYRAFRSLKLNYKDYDRIVMDFTKLNYVLDKVPAERLIVRAHNVEADYSSSAFALNRNFINFVESWFAGKREKIIVDQAACIVALTQKDKARFMELYHVPEEKIRIVPICLENFGKSLYKKPENEETGVETVRMIINGSLWFGPNYDGIKWFLDKVYFNLDFPRHLIIAGARPNEELIKRVSQWDTITLVDTPPSMQPYMEQADIAVAPVFNGAGMKVKVAEALSYGLPVAGTSHAFEGYEIEDGVHAYQADDAETFIEKLNRYGKLEKKERDAMRSKSYQLYMEKYSQTCSDCLFQEILNSTCV